jgi:hypothetical protein
MKPRSLLRISWAPAAAAAGIFAALTLLCESVRPNFLPSAVAYALLVLP